MSAEEVTYTRRFPKEQFGDLIRLERLKQNIKRPELLRKVIAYCHKYDIRPLPINAVSTLVAIERNKKHPTEQQQRVLAQVLYIPDLLVSRFSTTLRKNDIAELVKADPLWARVFNEVLDLAARDYSPLDVMKLLNPGTRFDTRSYV